MRKRILCLIVLVGMLFSARQANASQQEYTVLCYHDVVPENLNDGYGVDYKTFVDHIEYLLRHEYHFISLQDVDDARRGLKSLPDNSVLLTFDDGYVSYYDFVYPILSQYKIPSVFAIVTDWIDHKPDDIKKTIVSWEQVKELAQSPYVELASHTHDSHKGLIYNPFGNEAPAVVNRKFNDASGMYESTEDYKKRIKDDLKESMNLIQSKTGVKVRSIAWPYGKFNFLAVEAAEELGLTYKFALNDQVAHLNNVDVIHRYLVSNNPDMKQLLKTLKGQRITPLQKRIIQVDVDLVYDEDPQQFEINLGQLLDRIKSIKPSTVYLQAFADPEGTGNIAQVYFPNSVLPVRADIFNRIAHQLRTRAKVEVYAWMPVLSFILPMDQDLNISRVMEYSSGPIIESSSWYRRLSPFNQTNIKLIKQVYTDLAVNAWVDGVVFQDDAYLNHQEDYSESARMKFYSAFGYNSPGFTEMSLSELRSWSNIKMKTLNDLTVELMDIVLTYRPEVEFARTVYAPVVMNEVNDVLFSQSFEESLKLYDYVVVMAYPYMEGADRPVEWLQTLVDRAFLYKDAQKKTVFKVQAYDWNSNQFIASDEVDEWLQYLVKAGARNIAYYPDDYTVDEPKASVIRHMISYEDFPFIRRIQP